MGMEDYQPPQQMKKIGLDMSRFQVAKSNIRSERAELLEKFVTRLNNGRVAGGYKPLKPSFYATKMALIPTDELHAFYKELDQSKNFCALWWWKCSKKKS